MIYNKKITQTTEEDINLNLISSDHDVFHPLKTSSWNTSHNLDGIMAYGLRGQNKINTYIQVFRNGIIEIAECHLLDIETNGEYELPSQTVEKYFLDAYNESLKLFEKLELNAPYILFCSIVNLKGHKLLISDKFWPMNDGQKIREKNIIFKDILVNNTDTKTEEILRAIFDTPWNAFGYPYCYNYKNGKLEFEE